MKLKNLLISLLLSAGLLLTGCSLQPDHQTISAAPRAADCTYTCMMHPKVCADKPGHCPVCKMKLIKKERPK